MAALQSLPDLIMSVLQMPLQAYASIRGGDSYPDISGRVAIYPFYNGSIIIAEINNLPHATRFCDEKIYGFHIHEGARCQSDGQSPFDLTGDHFDTDSCRHPSHTGDLPPLFASDGYALLMFYTSRFYPEEVIGKTIIIHDMPDDFTTQPSGNSGQKIACGEIREHMA